MYSPLKVHVITLHTCSKQSKWYHNQKNRQTEWLVQLTFASFLWQSGPAPPSQPAHPVPPGWSARGRRAGGADRPESTASTAAGWHRCGSSTALLVLVPTCTEWACPMNFRTPKLINSSASGSHDCWTAWQQHQILNPAWASTHLLAPDAAAARVVTSTTTAWPSSLMYPLKACSGRSARGHMAEGPPRSPTEGAGQLALLAGLVPRPHLQAGGRGWACGMMH